MAHVYKISPKAQLQKSCVIEAIVLFVLLLLMIGVVVVVMANSSVINQTNLEIIVAVVGGVMILGFFFALFVGLSMYDQLKVPKAVVEPELIVQE